MMLYFELLFSFSLVLQNMTFELLLNNYEFVKFLLFYLLNPGDFDIVDVNFNWFIGVEFRMSFFKLDITLVRTGVDAFDSPTSGLESILFFNVNGPCIIQIIYFKTTILIIKHLNFKIKYL